MCTLTFHVLYPPVLGQVDYAAGQLSVLETICGFVQSQA